MAMRRSNVRRPPEELERDALVSQMVDTPYNRAIERDAPVDVGERGGAQTQEGDQGPIPAGVEYDPDPIPAGVDGLLPGEHVDPDPSMPGEGPNGNLGINDYLANIGIDQTKPGAATTAGQAANQIATGQGAFARYGTGNIPGAENVQRGNVGRLEGFNEGGWSPGPSSGYDDDTIKNTFGKVASKYAAKPSSIDAVLNDAEFKQFFPEAKKVSFDKIDFGNGKPVDVLTNADPNRDTARGWWWGTDSGGAAGAGAAGASGAAGGYANIAGKAKNAQEAYSILSGSIDPNAPKEAMEAAIAAAFGHLPGYEQAYKESVKINGVWYDLVRGYGADGAAFQGLTPKGGGSTAQTSSMPVVGAQDSMLDEILKQLGFDQAQGQRYADIPGDQNMGGPPQDLQAEIDAAQSGHGSPMDLAALIQLLNQSQAGA